MKTKLTLGVSFVLLCLGEQMNWGVGREKTTFGCSLIHEGSPQQVAPHI